MDDHEDIANGSSVAVYAVEDAPPPGWTVGIINEGGVFDAIAGKVKWGPFLDNQARTLTYEATRPAGVQGRQCFGPGVVSTDGRPSEICGNACVEPCCDHPAGADHDRRLVVDEVTGYAAAWKRGNPWPTPPNPIPIGYVTRAGALWKHGETYCSDPTQAPPTLWVNCPLVTSPAQAVSETVAGALATRIVTSGAGFPTVTIRVAAAGRMHGDSDQRIHPRRFRPRRRRRPSRLRHVPAMLERSEHAGRSGLRTDP